MVATIFTQDITKTNPVGAVLGNGPAYVTEGVTIISRNNHAFDAFPDVAKGSSGVELVNHGHLFGFNALAVKPDKTDGQLGRAHVTNGATGTMVGTEDAIDANGVLVVLNHGSIFGSRAIVVGDEGYIKNFGTIDASGDAIRGNNNKAGKHTILVENYGTISSEDTAIKSTKSLNLLNGPEGVVISNDDAVSVTKVKGFASHIVENAGYIKSLGGIELVGGFQVSFVNTGHIDVFDPISIAPGAVETDFRNSGLIEGRVELLGETDFTVDLRGGTITDGLSTGEGDDTVIVDHTRTVLRDGGGDDVIQSEVSFGLGSVLGFETLRLIGAEDVNGVGSSRGETISGNIGDNRIAGLGGRDALSGAAGEDTLRGGRGNDTLDGGTGDDVLGGGDGRDTVGGGDGTDTLRGGAGDDLVNGGDGDDLLIGGRGSDIYIGGGGADVFRFIKAAHIGGGGANATEIRDFTRGEDVIDLSAIQADPGAGNFDPGFGFIGVDTAFTGTRPGELRLNTSFGESVPQLEIDLDGNRSADLVIVVPGVTGFDAGDFIA